MSEVYTVSALARRWDVHPQTVYRLLKKGVVRSFRVGGKFVSHYGQSKRMNKEEKSHASKTEISNWNSEG